LTRSCTALLALAVGACSAKPPPEAAKPAAPVTAVERYLPLKAGTVMSYDTRRESSGETGILILRVNRPRPGLVELVGAAKTERLDITSDAVAYATGGYLLKAPLTLGASFRGRIGTVRVAAVDKQIEVPAGRFDMCLETVEDNTAQKARVTTVYCPNVGIVAIDAEGEIDGDYDRELARLRYHGPAVDLTAQP
jgi:hypothetical protein